MGARVLGGPVKGMALEAPPSAIEVLGLPVHQVDLAMSLAQIAKWIEDNHRQHPGTPTVAALHTIVTLNPEMVMAARDDPALARVIIQSDLTIADGIGIIWAARLRGQKMVRVTGVDLLEGTAQLAAQHGFRIFLLGAEPGVAAEAASRLAARYPMLPPVGTSSSGPHSGAEAAILAELADARPDILFVAFGSPAQERWIAGLHNELGQAGVSVAVGVGGALDFISGKIPRAPYVMRLVGLEWFYRLLQEPWRWRRMLALPRFVLAAWRAL
jgi:N-acetylglucosaminyldiphosphoundecaprenol N-acetyl-beta-D-mannosaminyltransferase